MAICPPQPLPEAFPMTVPQKQLFRMPAGQHNWEQTHTLIIRSGLPRHVTQIIYMHRNSLTGLSADVSKMKRDSITAFELGACLLLFIIQCILTAGKKRKERCTDAESAVRLAS